MDRNFAEESARELRVITGLLTALLLVGIVACVLLWKLYSAVS